MQLEGGSLGTPCRGGALVGLLELKQAGGRGVPEYTMPVLPQWDLWSFCGVWGPLRWQAG